MKKENIKTMIELALSIAVCLSAGIIGSLFTTPALPEWYAHLHKPLFTPPSWLFAPVWTILFILMGIAAFLIWKKGLKNKEVRLALDLFGIQLALNIFWSIAFFGLKSTLGGFLVIIILWLAIFLTIKRFYKLSGTAGLLLLPYIVWVSFAALLNLMFWLGN
jgi:benzodiazapine receptor